MINYQIVKYCRMCRKRFVSQKEDAKKIYCDKCHPKAKNEGYYLGGK